MRTRRPGRKLRLDQGGGYLVTLSHLWKLSRAWQEARGLTTEEGPYPQ